MRTHWLVLRSGARTSSFRVSTNGEDRGDQIDIDFLTNEVIMDVVLPNDEVFEPPPWVKHGIETRGWKVVSRPLDDSGLVYHGQVDWRAVAESLAGSLDAVLQQEDLSDTEPVERAGKALDDFRIAVTEVEMARPESTD